MSNNLPYWYSGFGTTGDNALFPPQAIPFKNKNKQWKKDVMDSLESIGLIQLRDNLKFKDFYRMIEGKMSYSEISEVIPQLREVEQMMDDLDIPTFLKHYDLIGIIINALVGEYMLNRDKFNVTNIDEISTNEYERTKQDLVGKYIQEEFEKQLNLRLVKAGYNPNVDEIDFSDEEQKQQYVENLQQQKNEMTPDEIEMFMNTKWRTKASIWGEHTLEADKERFYLDELDRNEILDFLLTGRCFRHFHIGYDYYKPETWSPINTFYSKDLETKYVQDGDYVGRIHYYTPAQLINKNADKFSENQKKEILGGKYSSNTNFGSEKNIFNNHFGETHIVPHKQHYDYEFMVGLQNEFGIPMGEKTMMKKDGSTVTMDSFLPNSNGLKGYSNAQELKDDVNLRTDLIMAVEVYFMSYKRIGYLTYEDESGRLSQEIVTEDILIDFLKENDIKQVTTKTLRDVEDNPEPNTIVWDYVPEVWKGRKYSGGNLSNPIYDVEPLEFQIKGDSNIYDIKLPVSGLVDSALALKIQPHQISYNVVMNQMYNLLEKEIGLFFLFDVNFLPSEYKEWGDTEETLMHLMNITKDTGLFPIDSSKQNIRDGGGFNGFSPQNLSFSSQLADRMQLSEFFKNKAFEQVGFNPARLGNPTKYETAEGVQQSQTASYAQTEIYFDKFSGYKKRTLEMHLAVAQYAQKEGKDVTIHYTKSDSTRAFLKFTDPYFQLRKLGIMAISNSKKRKELEQFKSYLMNTNTLGTDELALAKLFTSDTLVELIEVAREARLNREESEQATRQHELQVVQETAKSNDELDMKKWQREEFSKQKDRDNKIEVERIDALGRAADNDADNSSLDFINKQADLALKKQKQDADINIAQTEQNRKKVNDDRDYQLRIKELKNEVMKTKAMLEKSKDNKYIAEINKN